MLKFFFNVISVALTPTNFSVIFTLSQYCGQFKPTWLLRDLWALTYSHSSLIKCLIKGLSRYCTHRETACLLVCNMKMFGVWNIKRTFALKIGQKIGRHFFQRRPTNGQQALEKILTSLFIREIQIKTTVRYHFTPMRMVIIREGRKEKQQNKEKNNVGEHLEKPEQAFTSATPFSPIFWPYRVFFFLLNYKPSGHLGGSVS